MENINEELGYIKYLLGYERNKTLLEQKKLINEQGSYEYQQLSGQLFNAYKTTLTNLGFNYAGYYTIRDNKFMTNDLTTTPALVYFDATTELTGTDGKKYSQLYYSCDANVTVTRNDNYISTTLSAETFPSSIKFFRDAYAKKSTKDPKLTQAYKDQFTKEITEIANTFCSYRSQAQNGVANYSDVIKPIKDQEEYKAQNPTPVTAAPAAGTKPAATTTTTQPKVEPKAPVKIEGQRGQNNFTEPKFTVTYNKDYKKWIIEGFSSMVTSSADSGSFDDLLIKKIKEAIDTQKKQDENLRNNSTLITLTMAEVRGTSSNDWGGPISFNGKFKSGWKVIEEVQPEAVTDKYTKNIALAKRRANEVLTKIKSELPKVDAQGQKINVYGNLMKSDTKSYSIDTGGKCDSCPGRDWVTYPYPGQSIYVKLTIKLQGPPPNKIKSEGCLAKSKIRIGYFPGGASIDKGQKGHICDPATFDLYLNDKKVGTVDLGNGPLLNSDCSKFTDPSVKNFCLQNKGKFKNLSNTVSDTKAGGMRYADFAISASVAKEINNASKSGEVNIYVMGQDNNYYINTRAFKNPSGNEYTTHADTPWITLFPNKDDASNMTIDEAPFGSLPRCGDSKTACKKEFIMRYNPCGTDNVTTMMDSGVGEG
jgi:hypothetical protein